MSRFSSLQIIMSFTWSLFQPLSFDEREELINQIADGKYFRTQHPHGQLCLTAAAWAGSTEIIKTLVSHGADMALKNLDGMYLLA